MRISSFAGLGAFGGLLLLGGCVATQRDVLELSQQTDNLALKTNDLKKAMSSLQANQADLAVKLDQMHTDIAALTETLKDSQQGMSSLSSKMDDLGAALGSKVSSLGQSLDQQKHILEAHEQELKKVQDDAAKKAADEATGLTPSQIYHAAYVQLNQRKYETAAQGFELYLKKYPKGEVADLATYYLGQARYAQKKYEDSARQFALVLDHYPKSDLTPSARLMYATCLLRMKSHFEEAKRYLQSIPDDFPRSPEAKKASALLKEIAAKSTQKSASDSEQ